ncbi:putative deacetylase LmbE-like domain-containing protein [Irpex rosettiformis]|uniref:Deacetylase LmbE-like domain-containing protein n=1 Tax=Irpex rosettiformis TaxID=378272 RepID=A0ACB8U814_9APHY|nr:putative deacetylase LmbE-like domain-containing protein [Irpex rosettiformis]
MAALAHIAWFFVLVAFLVRALQGPVQSNFTAFQDINATETNILLLTAHPDDECMFFAPTLLGLRSLVQRSQKIGQFTGMPNLHSLCLSVGDADGLGNVRREELSRSLDVLGITEDRRQVVDRPDLQDDITSYWDKDVILQVVEPYIIQHNITLILTFDLHGISNHPNHKSLPHGALHLLSTFQQRHSVPPPRLFTLISHSIVDKYVGTLAPLLAKLDLLLGGAIQRYGLGPEPSPGLPVFVSGTREYFEALRAMLQHKSQLVWFRWLYVSFSRYMWVNEWMELLPQPEEV